MSYKIKCINCKNNENKNIITCGLCLNSLETKVINKIKIHNSNRSIFLRYRCFFSINNKQFLKKYPNNPTPVIKLHEKNIYAKLEYCSFSSSSKDREAFIEIAMARKLGYKGIAAASTGNMGAALASLCAMFKFPCFVFIPIDTSETKVKQIKQFGATVKKVAGNYDYIVPLVMKFAQNNNFFLASLQAFRFEGYKTIAYEIFETFGKNLPKNITIPLGDGTTYVGVWKGFNDLKTAGLINMIPSLIGVQAKQCAPIVDAYKNKSDIKVVNNPKTLAKAIRIGNPLDGEYSLRVAKITKGQMLSYKEEEIIKSQATLLKQGVNAEYASALTYCPVMFNNLNNCLLLITGFGFKN